MERKRNYIRGAALFIVACVTSPCCTPLAVPIIVGLLAGTPAAVWLTQNLGWVYGVLTLVSVMSLILGLNWLRQKSSHQGRSEQDTTDITTQLTARN